LTTYLNDHLAGAVIALELLDHLSERHAGSPWKAPLDSLRKDIQEDQASLKEILRAAGGSESATKQAMGWFSEKLGVARRALSPGYDPELATFEELEALALGIQGKLALWRTLLTAAPSEPALQGIDFRQLQQRAQDQHERAEALRLEAARVALDPSRMASSS
jgi:hypothetical protein